MPRRKPEGTWKLLRALFWSPLAWAAEVAGVIGLVGQAWDWWPAGWPTTYLPWLFALLCIGLLTARHIKAVRGIETAYEPSQHRPTLEKLRAAHTDLRGQVRNVSIYTAKGAEQEIFKQRDKLRDDALTFLSAEIPEHVATFEDAEARPAPPSGCQYKEQKECDTLLTQRLAALGDILHDLEG